MKNKKIIEILKSRCLETLPDDHPVTAEQISKAIRQEIKEMIKGMKISIDDKYDEEEKKMISKVFGEFKTPEHIRQKRIGYNQALEDIIKKLC